MIDSEQLKLQGIQIEETGEGYLVTSDKALSEVTTAELRYLLGSAAKFVVGEVANEKIYASAQNETALERWWLW